MSLKNEPDGFFACNKSVFVMGLIALIIAALIDLVAGFFLNTMKEIIIQIPGMMIMIYCAIGMRSNIFGAMGSRIGTSMHMGTFRMTFKKSVLRSNIEGAMALTLLLSAIMGIIGWIISYIFFKCTVGVLEFTFILLIGGLFAGVIVMAFNIAIAYVGYKRDWDVDNITAPLITAVGDFATIPMIYIATIMYIELGKSFTYVACIILLIVTIIVTILILLRKTHKRRRMDEAKRIVIQSTPVLVICMLLEIVAGSIIENETGLLTKYEILLILLPAFLNEGTALSGMLTSRLSSMLHLGTIDATVVPSKEVYKNFIIIHVLALIAFLFVGSSVFIFLPTLDNVSIIGLVLFAGMLTTAAINILSYYVAIITTKFHLNPDDHCIPITSSIMDIFGTGILMFVVSIFL